MTYSENVTDTASEKVTLVHIEPSQKLVIWTLDTGAVYYRDVDYFVIDVKNITTSLTEASSSSLSTGEWYNDRENGRLYVRLSDDTNPQDAANFMVATYRLFFSDAPYTLPHNLTDSGEQVCYEPLLSSTSNFPQEIDNAEQIGIALESNGSVNFDNTNGFFDGIFDKLFWENKRVAVYSWIALKPASQNRQMFEGTIENKRFSPKRVSFRAKDFVHKLREKVTVSEFSDSDGTISDAVRGKPKRTLYGQTDGVQCVPLDLALGGYDLTGTITWNRENEVDVTGVGTLFQSELSVNKIVKISNIEYTVISITSDTDMRIRSTDAIGDGVDDVSFEEVELTSLTGTVSATAPTTAVSGSVTLFTAELTLSDKIRVDGVDYSIDSITDDTNLVVDQTITTSFASRPFSKPELTTLTGVVSFEDVNRRITGTGTSFLSELSPDDELVFSFADTEYRFKIESIESDVLAIYADVPPIEFSNLSAQVSTDKPYRFLNRKWHIAGHKLREPSTTITSISQLNRFNADTTDMFDGDTIQVGSESVVIKRLSRNENLYVLSQNLDSLPSIGTTVTKNPVRACYFKGRKFLVDRDFTVTNTASDCYLEFDSLAEFNVTPVQSIPGSSVVFTSGSRQVTATGADFLNQISVNDWISSNDPTHAVFYQVLKVVDDDTLQLRAAYNGQTVTGPAKKKNVEYLDDNSVVLVDCIGKENSSGDWVKTASDVVLDLVTDAGFTNISTTDFDDAVDEANHIMALKIPLEPGNDAPSLRDVVGLVNKSVFGSLYVKSDWSLAYKVLSAERPQALDELNDSDIDSFSVSTSTEIVRRVFSKYNHFDADRFTEEPGSAVSEFENSFVDRLVGSKETLIEDIYLFEQRAAETITQRYALLNSLTQSIVSVKAKLDLTLKNINDKLFLGLDRIYRRFGTPTSHKKIGIISRISRKGDSTDVQFSDLGNIFNRVGTVTPDTANDFTSASDTEKMLNGYIVDNDTELPDSSPSTDDEWNTNLIG